MNGSLPEGLIEILACPECREPLRAPRVDEPGGQGDAPLVCSGCSRRFQAPGGIPLLYPDDIDTAHMEEEEKLGELMERYVPAGKELFFEEQWEASKQEFWDCVRESLGPGTGRMILNAGCGIDTHFLGLAGGGDTLVAFDMMHPLLTTLKERHGSTINVAGVVQALPFRDGTFDCVCCIDLIHHEPGHTKEIIGSFHRLLKPGGVLLLEDINAWGLFQFWKSILMPRRLHGALRSMWHDARRSSHRPADYEFPTSVHQVARMLRSAGFTSVEAVPQHAYPNVGPSGYKLFRLLSRWPLIAKYHDFHYLLRAEKSTGRPG
ncbi:MAG TPA: methyltransferase domain-containing protein [Candidatus Krumholzibacterium sp.]|nr:methyltransferase domain-containing protein [Candidatus Krumholzibacterium sp.]